MLYVPPPLLCVFALYSKSKGNPYLKVINVSQLFVSDAPIKGNLVLPPLIGLCFWYVKSPIEERVKLVLIFIRFDPE